MPLRSPITKAHTFLLSLCSLSLGLTLSVPIANASTMRQNNGPTPVSSYPMALNQKMDGSVPVVQDMVPGAPSIVSQSAVVMDLSTGTVVYAKDPSVSHYPASITKIMTAMLALEHGKLTDKLKVTQLAANQPADRLDLVPGEVHSLQSFLYPLLLYSANDAAVVIAQHYGGSVQGFANMMNAKARALGAVHTHFVNPNGLPNPSHVTTAYDMALIARAAMQIPEFRKIVDTTSYPWNGVKWQTTLYNINHFLTAYPGAIGLKTGYTSVAHETLVVAAKHGDQTFLAVLMDAPTDFSIRQDATNLMNFAFSHYQTMTVLPEHDRLHVTVKPTSITKSLHIPVSTRSAVLATVPIGTTFHVSVHPVVHLATKAISQGATIGTLMLSQNGETIGQVPLVSDVTIQPTPVRHRVSPFDISLMMLLLTLIGLMSRQVFRPRSRLGLMTPPRAAIRDRTMYGARRMEQD